jgi:hypothetical protein
MVQKWEYKMITPKRHVGSNVSGYSMFDVEISLAKLLVDFGEEGWELAAISTKSGVYGALSAGNPDDVVWIFKRPVERPKF